MYLLVLWAAPPYITLLGVYTFPFTNQIFMILTQWQPLIKLAFNFEKAVNWVSLIEHDQWLHWYNRMVTLVTWHWKITPWVQ